MADFISDLGSGLKNNLIPDGGVLNRKIDFQREKFLKGVSTTKHGKKEDPTYIYFKFIFDFGDTSLLDPETFLPPSPIFRSYREKNSGDASVYQNLVNEREREINQQGNDPNATQSIADKLEDGAASGFQTDTDFFYGAKARIDGRLGTGFFSINGGLGYMGAQQFLYQRSKKRQQMLEAFKKGINFINKECPYYFQSLSGLDSLLKTDIKNYHKPGGAPKRTGTLTIDCLESIDMRMFSLAELYRKAVYDYTYHRIMVPENLRKFRMWLVITELRNIQLSYGINDVLNPFSIPSVAQTAGFLDNFNSQTGLLDQATGLLQRSTNTENPGSDKFGTYSMGPYAFVYQFDQCEFDFDGSYPSYSSIDNKGGSAVSHQFKIHVGRVKDYKIQFNQLSDVIKKDNNIQQMVLSDIWGSPAKSSYNDFDYFSTAGIENVTFSDKPNPGEFFAGLASNFITNTVADLKNQGVSILENKLLGNIYGFGGFNATQAASSVQSLVSTINAGVPNPFGKNDPQSNGYGGPKERAYPPLNSDLYPNNPAAPNQNLGNVISGGSSNQPGLQSDVYGNVPGSDLGLPDRTYPSNNSDEYNDVPGADLGVPNRVYPVPGGDQYTGVPGTDLGLPNRTYPANNSDEYNDVPGADLGVPNRVYPVPGGDQYSGVPGADLGLPNRTYPSNNSDEYNDVPGADLGVPNRVYPVPGGDQYPDTPGVDLGLPDRTYPAPPAGDEYPDNPGSDLGVPTRVYPTPGGDEYPDTPGADLGLPDRQYPAPPTGDEYPDNPGSDLGVPTRVYPTPGGDEYPNTPGPELGLPDRQYPAPPTGDEYPNVPGTDLGPNDRVYPAPGGDQYPNTPGPELGLPDRQYPAPPVGDEYADVPGRDLGPIGRIYPAPNEDKYPNTPGPELGLPGRQYPSAPTLDEYGNTPGADLGVPGRQYPPLNSDVYSNVPGSDLGVKERQYPSNNQNLYNEVRPAESRNLGRIYPTNN